MAANGCLGAKSRHVRLLHAHNKAVGHNSNSPTGTPFTANFCLPKLLISRSFLTHLYGTANCQYGINGPVWIDLDSLLVRHARPKDSLPQFLRPVQNRWLLRRRLPATSLAHPQARLRRRPRPPVLSTTSRPWRRQSMPPTLTARCGSGPSPPYQASTSWSYSVVGVGPPLASQPPKCSPLGTSITTPSTPLPLLGASMTARINFSATRARTRSSRY